MADKADKTSKYRRDNEVSVKMKKIKCISIKPLKMRYVKEKQKNEPCACNLTIEYKNAQPRYAYVDGNFSDAMSEAGRIINGEH